MGRKINMIFGRKHGIAYTIITVYSVTIKASSMPKTQTELNRNDL